MGFPRQEYWSGLPFPSPDNAGDIALIPDLGRSPGEVNGNPLQYSCLEISWTEQPGGLQFMRLQKRHNLATRQQQAGVEVPEKCK